MGANIDQRAIFEFSPLHTAVQFNEIAMSQFLTDFGADPECPTFDKETPLLLAARLGNSSMCESLIGNGAKRMLKMYGTVLPYITQMITIMYKFYLLF